MRSWQLSSSNSVSLSYCSEFHLCIGQGGLGVKGAALCPPGGDRPTVSSLGKNCDLIAQLLTRFLSSCKFGLINKILYLKCQLSFKEATRTGYNGYANKVVTLQASFLCL